MPVAIKRVAAGLILLLAPALLPAYEPPAASAPRPFRYETDSFAFANETVWNYVNGAVQADSARTGQKRDYTRRCFVVTRAAVQFWKFARFDPSAPALPSAQLAERIREVTERSVWQPPLPRDQRIVFPGYASLRAISAANPAFFSPTSGWAGRSISALATHPLPCR